MTKLQRLRIKHDQACDEYDELFKEATESGNGLFGSDLIRASNKTQSAFYAWQMELDGGVLR